eukprot:m51a1_g14531 hypothetical protein (857) ;mRNA; f:933978-939496
MAELMDRVASASTLTRRSVDLAGHAGPETSPGDLVSSVVPSAAPPPLRLSAPAPGHASAVVSDTPETLALNQNRVEGDDAELEASTSSTSLLEQPQQPRGATIAGSAVNLVNTLLGAGMLGMPYMCSHAGMALGPVLVVAFGLLGLYGIRLLYDCAEKMVRERIGPERPTFYSLASQARKTLVGVVARGRVVDGAVFTMCFCTLVAYLMILGDLIPSTVAFVATDAWPAFLLSKSFWLPVAMVPLALVCFVRRLDSMLWGSVVVLVSVVYLVLLVGVFASYNGWRSSPRPHIRALPHSLKVFGVLPIVFTVYNEFSSDNGRRSWISANIAFLVSGFVYVVIGTLGYATFGAAVSPNLINSYPTSSVPILVARLFAVFLIGFSYPVMLHPARSSMDKIVFASLPRWKPTVRHAVETVALLGSTFVLAFFIESLDLVIGFCGSTGSTLVSFVLPGLFYVRLTGAAAEMMMMQVCGGQQQQQQMGAAAAAGREAGVLAAAAQCDRDLDLMRLLRRQFATLDTLRSRVAGANAEVARLRKTIAERERATAAVATPLARIARPVPAEYLTTSPLDSLLAACEWEEEDGPLSPVAPPHSASASPVDDPEPTLPARPAPQPTQPQPQAQPHQLQQPQPTQAPQQQQQQQQQQTLPSMHTPPVRAILESPMLPNLASPRFATQGAYKKELQQTADEEQALQALMMAAPSSPAAIAVAAQFTSPAHKAAAAAAAEQFHRQLQTLHYQQMLGIQPAMFVSTPSVTPQPASPRFSDPLGMQMAQVLGSPGPERIARGDRTPPMGYRPYALRSPSGGRVQMMGGPMQPPLMPVLELERPQGPVGVVVAPQQAPAAVSPSPNRVQSLLG